MKKTIDPSAGAVCDVEREKRLLSTAGLAARARKTVIGTDQICDALRARQVILVLEASDTSDNTHKRLSDKTSYYGVRLCRVSADCEMLATAFGKKNGSIAAVGITDKGIVRAMEKYLPGESREAPEEKQ